MFKSRRLILAAAISAALGTGLTGCNDEDKKVIEEIVAALEGYFDRVATYPVCKQIDSSCDTDEETVAEIVAASADGNTLIYTDSPQNQVGFVHISNPADPVGLGTVGLSGEPTSVATLDGLAVVGVNTSGDFINTSGELAVIDIATRSVVRTIDMGGQPDSVAVSPDGAYIAIAIENERDEDLGDGRPPQLPAGFLMIVDVVDIADPSTWTTRMVDMTALADLFPDDPEPEYVDINDDNIAVVTMQENNHLVLVDLSDGSIVNHFSAGMIDLDQIDTEEEDPALVMQDDTLSDVVREPDGVTWISTEAFVTANEGDMDGGSRGFTVWDTDGNVLFDSGNSVDHIAVRNGSYPDGRSGNKGAEPENAEFGRFGESNLMFLNSERASFIAVYDMMDPTNPRLHQVLPAAAGPEGVVAIPSRNLLVAASEEDNRGDKMRGGLNIYHLDTNAAAPAHPTITSDDRADGTPIPWSAISGLTETSDPNMVYAVEDSFFQQSRMLGIDVSAGPAVIVDEVRIRDTNDVLAATPVDTGDPGNPFDAADRAAMINADKTVNLDQEGIAASTMYPGSFWIANEGSGTFDDPGGRPVTSPNMVLRVAGDGTIEEVIRLPAAFDAVQLRFGFEGVDEYNGKLYVAVQRAWDTDPNPRIGVFDLVARTWESYFYPLDAPESQNGGWVGLSEITSLGGGMFMVVERDNQGGPDAAIKRLYTFDVTGLSDGDTIVKTLANDLMDELASTGALTFEKIEGAALLSSGDVLIANDNDGVDDNSGETQLLNIGPLP